MGKIGDAGRATWRLLTALGSRVLCLSESASHKYADHQQRGELAKASVDVLRKDAESLIELRTFLAKKLIECNEPVEKLRLQRDLEDIASRLRQSSILERAMGHLSLPEGTSGSARESDRAEKVDSDQSALISPHWLDICMDWAKKHNEEWRQNLLARALALEADKPGSIDLRVLWLIGTLDERSFRAFGAFLGVATKVGETYFFPDVGKHASEMFIENEGLGNVRIGNLSFILSESGLMADTLSSQVVFQLGQTVEASFGDSHVRASIQGKKLEIMGFMTSFLGSSLAKLCTIKGTEFGKQQFEAWVERLKSRTEAHLG